METDRTLQPDIHSDDHFRYLMNDYCQASSFSHIYIYIHIHIYIYIYEKKRLPGGFSITSNSDSRGKKFLLINPLTPKSD